MKKSLMVSGLTGLALLLIVIPLVFSNGDPDPPPCEPGYSPGFWKHQLKAHYNDRGHIHVPFAIMETFAADIDSELKSLGEVDDFDYDEDGSFTTMDTFLAFTDPTWNHKWTPLGNWFNWAAGYAPYTENDNAMTFNNGEYGVR